MIIGLIDGSGTSVVQYTYDAWGNQTSCTGTLANTLGQANPYRYRGYRFDSESGLYYLQSRYYDAGVGRFVNADGMLFVNYFNSEELNLFSYCVNNPVMYTDISGYCVFGIQFIIGAAIIAAIINAVSTIVSNILAGLRGRDILKGVLGAAIGGAVNATLLLSLWYVPVSMVFAAVAGGIVQALFDFIENVIVYKTANWGQLGIDVLLNSASNCIGNFLGAKLVYIDKNWMKPKYFMALFNGPFGRRILAQSGIGAAISGMINFIRKKLIF